MEFVSSKYKRIDIQENKNENLYFFIQIDKEVFKPFFNINETNKIQDLKENAEVNNTDKLNENIKNKKQLKRIDVILEEIPKIVRLRGYATTCSMNFSLSILFPNGTVSQLIDLSHPSIFIDKFNSSRSYINSMEKEIKSNENSSKIKYFSLNFMLKSLDLSKEKQMNNDTFDTFKHFILFYNNSYLPVEYDKYYSQELPLLPNFFFDIIYLHEKIKTNESKIECEKVFKSLNSFKSSRWYSFENSGNLKSFQYYCYLLMCSPGIRIEQSKIIQHQNNINQNLYLCQG